MSNNKEAISNEDLEQVSGGIYGSKDQQQTGLYNYLTEDGTVVLYTLKQVEDLHGGPQNVDHSCMGCSSSFLKGRHSASHRVGVDPFGYQQCLFCNKWYKSYTEVIL